MRINSKGQVTIPAELRHQFGFHEGDEVDVVADGETLQIVHAPDAETRGQRIVRQMRGTLHTSWTTDELMELLRGE